MLIEPHPRWKVGDKSDRHPQTLEEWDRGADPIGGALNRSLRRLNVAVDYADPRAPDQLALVHRGDLSRALADRTHKNAAWECWRTEEKENAVYAAYLGICVLQTMCHKTNLRLAEQRCIELIAELGAAFPHFAGRAALRANEPEKS